MRAEWIGRTNDSELEKGGGVGASDVLVILSMDLHHPYSPPKRRRQQATTNHRHQTTNHQSPFAIEHQRRSMSFGWIIVMPFIAAILIGFAYTFHEVHTSLTFASGSSNIDGRADSTYVDVLRPFSDREAMLNTAKVNQWREWYSANYQSNDRIQQLGGNQMIWPKQPPESLISAIHYNATASNVGREVQELADLLSNDNFWKRDGVAPCQNVVLDLGSNRGDTLASFLNVALTSLYSASLLKQSSSTYHDCINKTPAFKFDISTMSIEERSFDEQSQRHWKIYNRHQIDMEFYLEVSKLSITPQTSLVRLLVNDPAVHYTFQSTLKLHIGQLDGEGDPWMEFQLQQKQNEGRANLPMLQHLRRHHSTQHRPDIQEYCFYGVEGNPAFTRRLRGLEYWLMSMGGERSATKRRPLRHVHFFTETVATSENGPTTLYLDSVSTNQVGSSLLRSHKYAVMGGVKGTQVEGVTLTRLLGQVLAGFINDNEQRQDLHLPNGIPAKIAPPNQNGRFGTDSGHLILKVDIEGGEYGVLEEALKSGLLCQYASKTGIRVDLVVEFHRWVIEDSSERQQYASMEKHFYNKLKSCGVYLTKMTIDWH